MTSGHAGTIAAGQPDYQVCVRCVVDSSVPGASFDADGVCHYCRMHDTLTHQFPKGAEGARRLAPIVEAIKKAGAGKKFDCVVGISGGRDSMYMLYKAVEMGLRPLAVHFNDGFGNPVAGENMTKVCKALGVEFRIVTSDWRESKDLKLAFLKASTPDLEEGTDVGIAATLYAAAARENIDYVLSGHCFRTEGIMPLDWNYLDGRYLKKVHERFGTVKLRPWRADDAGFHLDIPQILYYAFWRRIKIVPIFYYLDYSKKVSEEFLVKEFGWVYPGAKYFDDLYQSVMTYVYRVKFNIDRRRINYSAFVREGQKTREEALAQIAERYSIEDEKIIGLCLKRLGISREEFDKLVAQPPKTFRDYPSCYSLIRLGRWPIWLLSRMGVLPSITYAKYFES